MPGLYFDRRGRFRGARLNFRDVWFLGFLWLLFLPITTIVWYFPRAVWRLGIAPAARLAIIAVVWGGLGIAGAIEGVHEAAQAQARGCVAIAELPRYYVDPTKGENRCPDGFLPGPDYYKVNPTPTPSPSPPSASAQQAACASDGGPEAGPDFPPPVYDKSAGAYIVSCMDGTSKDVPVSPAGSK